MESQPSDRPAPPGDGSSRPWEPGGASRCPDCGAELGERPPARCLSCRLPLRGDVAARLWRVEQGLAAVEERRGQLLAQREELLVALRALRYAPDPAPVPGSGSVWAGPQGGRQAEVSGRSAQTALLVLGGALVVVAALVFTVVSWGHLGIGGRAAVLFALTGCALAAPLPLRRRGLAATAETFATIGLVLVLLDCYAMRAGGLAGAGAVGAPGYWAACTALVAAGSAVYGGATRMRAPLVAGFLLGRLPALLAVHAVGLGGLLGNATALAATTAADYGVLRWASARDGLRGRLRLDGLLPPAGAIAALWGLAGGALAVEASLVAVVRRTAAAVDGGTMAPVWAWLPLGVLALVALAVARPYPGPGIAGLTVGARGLAAAVAGAAVLAAAGGPLGALLPADWCAVGYMVPAALLAVGAGAALSPRGGRPSGGPGAGTPGVVPTGLFRAAGLVLLAGSFLPLTRLVPALFEPLAHLAGAWATPAPAAPAWAWKVPAAGLTGYWLLIGTLAALRALDAEVLRPVRPEQSVQSERPEHPERSVKPEHPVQPAKSERPGAPGATARPEGPPAWTDPVLAVAAVPGLALLPVAFGLPYGAAAGTAAALAVAAAGCAVLRPARPAGPAALVVAAALALLWALADRPATILVLALGAVLATALTVTLASTRISARISAWITARTPAAGAARATTAGGLRADVTAVCAVLALGGEAVAAGATAGLALPDIVLALLAVAVGSAPVAARISPRQVSRAVEGTGYLLAAVACTLTAGHPERLALVLTVAGVAGLGVALRADRRRAATVTAVVLLIAASWLRLALWDVRTPEAYSLTVSAAALVLGVLRRRRDAGANSWAAYGPGLVLGLAPSLVAVWADGNWLRPLLLGGAAALVTVLGVRHRLQGPLLLGGAVLLLVGVHELAPTVVQVLGLVPRWVPLAAVGLLLLALGATYEQRLRDARRLRAALGRLG
ncbi:hypothetical protein J5Y04_38345 [Kitasatospora sp. RG8]|uniref:SCO7613 C-terminal domain-containing membrane protein n=1 Tax=Kitasatospora sp. RG8 TaxID=2820815 RepID=UPI001AE06BBE|nr:hypothetical protein [Kitasatospora sp. RG8]MBP0455338.1 hypothetical protein [Kitasatospora sp. RG8]